MTELLTAQQMKDLEQAAMDSGAVTGLELMERAGQGVFSSLLARWPELATGPRRAVVLCGPGNNGGDGFVIARLLVARGWRVRVHMWGDPAKLPPDAAFNHGLWVAAQHVHPMEADEIYQGVRPDVLIDAVFGIGISRALPKALVAALDPAGAARWQEAQHIKRVAVDCPSGFDLDRGDWVANGAEHEGAAKTRADLTVTFHAPKIGHYCGSGPAVCGQLEVVDIGLGEDAAELTMIGQSPVPERIRLIEPRHQGNPISRRIWPLSYLPKSRTNGHKYNHGHAIVFAGGVGQGGAGRLAARAALRIGAGLVTVVCPPEALAENASQLNAIMLRPLGEESPLKDVADHRITAFCLGPGMGVSEQTRSRVSEALSHNGVSSSTIVLDADALTSFADDPSALFAQTHADCVLTPHEGEFARLFPDLASAKRGALSKVEAARQAAARAGCLVLLKGPDTVIAAPDGRVAVHAAVYDRSAPWLATAGSGDVLAGLIAGLAASPAGPGLFSACEIAVWLHVEAARAFGPGLIAEDLPEGLPKVLADCATDPL